MTNEDHALATLRWFIVLCFIVGVLWVVTDIRSDVNAIKHSVVTTTTTHAAAARVFPQPQEAGE